MPTLYHFTGLFFLPEIAREGINRGEVPLGPHDVKQAPNLTSNPNALAHVWATSCRNKLRVRLLVNIPDGDRRLEPWRDVCKRCKVDRKWQRALDPTGQGKFWYIYWGVVLPEWCRVEVRQENEYQLQTPEGLSSLIREIEIERQKFNVLTSPQGLRALELKPDIQESWLLDEEHDSPLLTIPNVWFVNR